MHKANRSYYPFPYFYGSSLLTHFGIRRVKQFIEQRLYFLSFIFCHTDVGIRGCPCMDHFRIDCRFYCYSPFPTAAYGSLLKESRQKNWDRQSNISPLCIALPIQSLCYLLVGSYLPSQQPKKWDWMYCWHELC